MSKRHSVTLNHVITVYNDMFDHLDGVLRALIKKKTQWKKDLYIAVRHARTKLTKYYSEVTPETGMLLIMAQILDPFRKVRPFVKWDRAMNVNPEDEGSYTTQYKEAFLKYVEREYCTTSMGKQGISSSGSQFHQSSRDPQSSHTDNPYLLSSDDDEDYESQPPPIQATPGKSDRAARLLTAARLYVNSPLEHPANWGQINPYLNDYLTDPLALSGAFWRADAADWWRQQEESHTKYADLANVARDIFSVMPHGVGVEASFSLGRDIIGWRQTRTSADSLRQKVVVRQFARSNHGLLAGDNSTTLPSQDEEMKKEEEEKKLHRMVKIHDFMELWQGSLKLRRMQKDARAQNKSMTAIGYISDTEETEDMSSSSFHHDGSQAFITSGQRSLPPALSKDDLLDGENKVLYIKPVHRLNRNIDEDSASEIDTDREDWLNWDGDIDEESEMAGGEDSSDSGSDSEITLDRSFDEAAAAPIISGLIRPVRKSVRIENRTAPLRATAERPETKGGKNKNRK